MVGKDRDPVINDCSEITARWLADTLRAAGRLPTGEVRSLSVTLWRRQRYADLHLLEAVYEGNADLPLPARFMLKVSREGVPPAVVRRRRWKEHEFYARVVPAMEQPPVPRPFAAAYDPSTGRAQLLMEDLTASHTRPPTPLPPTADQLRLAVGSLAQIHGCWWAHPDILQGAAGRDDTWIARKSRKVQETFGRFLTELGEYLPVATRAALDTVDSAWPTIMRRSTTSPLTLVHGDAHPWNVLFPRERDGGGARLLDWEGWDLEPGPHDLASLVALHVPTALRSAWEEGLLEHYVRRLHAHGAEQSLLACRDDYRRAVARRVYSPIGMWARGSDARSWWPALERITAAFHDLRCDEVL